MPVCTQYRSGFVCLLFHQLELLDCVYHTSCKIGEITFTGLFFYFLNHSSRFKDHKANTREAVLEGLCQFLCGEVGLTESRRMRSGLRLSDWLAG